MSRKAGSTSSVFIPLAELTAKLTQAGITSPKVAVSKGWVAAMQEAHDIDFDLPESTPATDGTDAAPATSQGVRPRLTVEE